MTEREIWDAYDENENLLGYDIYRGDPIPDGVYHVLVEIYTFTTDGEVLTTQRHPDKGYPLKWETTGGSKLKGETPLQAARRELGEETGVVVREEDLRLIFKAKRHPGFWYCYATVVDKAKTKIKLQDGETVDYRWLPYDEFKAFVQTEEFNAGQRKRFNDEHAVPVAAFAAEIKKL